MPVESRQLSRLTEFMVTIDAVNAPFKVGTNYFSVNLAIIPAAS